MLTIFRRKDVDVVDKEFVFYSKRYNKTSTVPLTFMCDGATGVKDTKEKIYRLHDWNFFAAIWDDGTPMSFEEANNNYTDCLLEHGHWFIARTRKALHIVGRSAWKMHREREMVFHNVKLLEQLK